MKRLLPVLSVLSLLMLEGCSSSFLGSWSVDYQSGLVAYKKGDYATAWRKWVPLAKEGLEEAQLNLGMMYEKGQGVPKNERTAIKWYALAADQGHDRARNNLERLLAKSQKRIIKSSKSSPFKKARKQCVSIGFKEGTEKFGDCVMKLID